MKKLLFVVVLLLVLALIYTRWMKSVATIRSLKNIESQTDSVFAAKNESLVLNPELFELSKEKSFLAAKASLLKADSISLLIDLADSTLSLFYKGVVLQSAKVDQYDIDEVLQNLKPTTHLAIFSQPLNCTETFSSIVKEPIIVKKAPANEQEAVASLTLPDSIKKEPVFIWYEAGNNIELVIAQTLVVSKTEKAAYKKFQKYIGKKEIKQHWFNVAHPKESNYKPKIQIWINHTDAMTFYRAIPVMPQVVIRF